MKIAIDIDGVLANFESGFAPILTRLTDITFPVSDPEFPPVWGWPMHYMTEAGRTRKEARDIESLAWEIVKNDNQFWQSLQPYPHTLDILERLAALRADGHDIYFITHRFGVESKKQTERWLHLFGMICPTVLKTGRKGPVLASLEIDCFIDDKPSNCEEVLAYSINHQGSTRVYVCDKPYNREVLCGPRMIRVAGVQEMLDAELRPAEDRSGDVQEIEATNG